MAFVFAFSIVKGSLSLQLQDLIIVCELRTMMLPLYLRDQSLKYKNVYALGVNAQ